MCIEETVCIKKSYCSLHTLTSDWSDDETFTKRMCMYTFYVCSYCYRALRCRLLSSARLPQPPPLKFQICWLLCKLHIVNPPATDTIGIAFHLYIYFAFFLLSLFCKLWWFILRLIQAENFLWVVWAYILWWRIENCSSTYYVRTYYLKVLLQGCWIWKRSRYRKGFSI